MPKTLLDAVYASVIGDALGAPALLAPSQRSAGEDGLNRKTSDGNLWKGDER